VIKLIALQIAAHYVMIQQHPTSLPLLRPFIGPFYVKQNCFLSKRFTSKYNNVRHKISVCYSGCLSQTPLLQLLLCWWREMQAPG